MSNDEPVWFIQVRETTYGPYSEDRMRAFAGEGRLSARSMVSLERDGDYHTAADDEILAGFFVEAGSITPEPDASASPQGQGAMTTSPGSAARFVIFARITEHSRAGFMGVLSGYGIAIEAMDDVWLLSAHASAATLRNAMSRVLSSEDVLFVADASQGASAWFNVGQETDKRIRQFWQESE